MRVIVTHSAFWILLIAAVVINLSLMYLPRDFHFVAMLIWLAISLRTSVQLRRAWKSSGAVVTEGLVIGLLLTLILSKPADWLVPAGFGSFDNVDYALLHKDDEDPMGEEQCWGSHGPTSCY